MGALIEMNVSVSELFRDNSTVEIPSERIVLGDILIL